MGEKAVADKLLLKEIEAEKEELKNRFLGVSSYYKEHYDWPGRLKNGARLVALGIAGWLWGHGLRIGNIFRSAVVAVLVFALLFYRWGAFSVGITGDESVSFFEAVYISMITFTTLGYGDYTPVSTGVQLLCAAESFLGIVFLGFLAAAAYRRLAR
jgi:hypothetical protein